MLVTSYQPLPSFLQPISQEHIILRFSLLISHVLSLQIQPLTHLLAFYTFYRQLLFPGFMLRKPRSSESCLLSGEHGVKSENRARKEGASPARPQSAEPEKGEWGRSSHVQLWVQVIRQVHGDEATARWSPEGNLLIRVGPSRVNQSKAQLHHHWLVLRSHWEFAPQVTVQICGLRG